jgi:hypothetical protein
VTSPDPNITTVRALTGASTSDIDDAGITALLAEENGAPKLAAALVLELMAGRLQAVTSDDITVDGTKQAQVLMNRAAQLRAQFYEHGGDFFFDSAPVVPDYAGESWWNDTDTSYDCGVQ